MSKLFVTAGLICLAAVLCGCGSGTNDGLHPLAGTAAFNGEPIDLGSIALIPAGGGSEQRASGGVIQDGKFTIPREKGLNPGTYRVEVHWLKKTGKRVLDKEIGAMYDERVEALPAEFHADSDLTIEIPAPDNKHDLDLKAG